MTDDVQADMWKAVEAIVVAASALLPDSRAPVRVRTLLRSGGMSGVYITTVDVFDHSRGEPLTSEKRFALTVLLGEDDTVIAHALADFMLDKGFDYATAVAEKAAKDERDRIAERLYSESALVLSRGPDPDGRFEFAAAALSSVADDLVFGVPPTAPKVTE